MSKTRHIYRILSLIFLATLLSACASGIPENIRTPPPGSPNVAQVRSNVQQYVGTKVRWGGVIAKVDNEKSRTLVEIVSRPLNGDGRPKQTNTTEGRFIAVFNHFLDPSIYAKDRELTVVGTLTGEETRTIGQYPYRYPMVAVQESYLWEPRPAYYYPAWYYDPWDWGPWGPWGPYGYWPYHRYPYWW